MSPRSKTASDADILDAAARVILRVGPTSLRLSDVAAEVGLAPATIIQRFKSKRALLLAVAANGTKTIADEFASRRQRATSPLDALLAISPQVRELTRSRRCITNKLAFLQLGFSDRVLQRHLIAHNRAVHNEIRRLLDDAVTAGELRPCDTMAIARALMAVWFGSLLMWALSHGRGSGEEHIRADIEALLGPHRTSAPTASSHRSSQESTGPARNGSPHAHA